MPKWGKYKKLYKKEWEADPELKTCIAHVLEDSILTQTSKRILMIWQNMMPQNSTSPTVRPVSNLLLYRQDLFRARTRMTKNVVNLTCGRLVGYSKWRAFKMRRTKCTAVIKSVLVPHFREEVKEDIGESLYSLYLAETTNISVS